MKATIKFKDWNTGKERQKTLEVTKNEPNQIVREFIRFIGTSKHTYINTIKCGRIEYQWFGHAYDAF